MLIPFEITIGKDLYNALDFPPYLAEAFWLAGLCILLIGVMAWFSSQSTFRRRWGRRIALSGVALAVVGFGFSAVKEVIEYVLTP